MKLRSVFQRITNSLRKALLPELMSLGSEYGCWTFCPTLINSGSVVYSFGVGEDISWDSGLIEKFGVLVHAFDPTPRAISFAKNAGISGRFVMNPHGVHNIDGTLEFFMPENPQHVSLSYSRKDTAPMQLPVKRLTTILAERGHQHIDVLKMDIEGSEYAVISELSSKPVPITQLLVEFHHGLHGFSWSDTETALEQLRQMGFILVHVSGTGREYSFLHRSAYLRSIKQKLFGRFRSSAAA